MIVCLIYKRVEMVYTPYTSETMNIDNSQHIAIGDSNHMNGKDEKELFIGRFLQSFLLLEGKKHINMRSEFK